MLRRGGVVFVMALLLALYFVTSLHPLYLVGVGGVAFLLAYEHSLVRADDLSRVNVAFFTLNGRLNVVTAALEFTVLAVRLGPRAL